MKYIMFKNKVAYVPFIFGDSIPHISIVEAFKLHPDLCSLEPVSAGSILICDVEVSGSSSTLKIDSRKIDSQIIENHDYMHGIISLYEE